MRFVTVAGPPSCGKTSVLLKAADILKDRGLRCGVVKFDCLSTRDAELYGKHGISALAAKSGSQCPDHYFASNVEQAFEWGIAQNLDLLITESAGLCNRCSPYLEGVLSVCVLDNLAGMGAPRKIGPLLRCADVVVVTKGDVVSQAEREVFAYCISQLATNTQVIQVNGLTGQGALLLADRMSKALEPDGDVISHAKLRYPMPNAVCSFCIGETRIGRMWQTGNIVPLFDDLPALELTEQKSSLVSPNVRETQSSHTSNGGSVLATSSEKETEGAR